MVLRLTPAVRNAAVNGATALADAGSGPATVSIYTGSQPASAEDAPTGTLIATFTLSDPAYGVSVDGVAPLTTGGGIATVAVAGGTAGWGRLADSNGNTIYDGNCGISGSPQFTLNATSITIGQVLLLTAGSISVPSGE